MNEFRAALDAQYAGIWGAGMTARSEPVLSLSVVTSLNEKLRKVY